MLQGGPFTTHLQPHPRDKFITFCWSNERRLIWPKGKHINRNPAKTNTEPPGSPFSCQNPLSGSMWVCPPLGDPAKWLRFSGVPFGFRPLKPPNTYHSPRKKESRAPSCSACGAPRRRCRPWDPAARSPRTGRATRRRAGPAWGGVGEWGWGLGCEGGWGWRLGWGWEWSVNGAG